MPRVAKPGRVPRIGANTAKYDAHHSVLNQTYGALADLRSELSDSKEKIAERGNLLNLFGTCMDSQRATGQSEKNLSGTVGRLSFLRRQRSSH